MNITPESARFPERKALPHDIPEWVKPGSTFFITLCCRPRGRNQLCFPQIAKLIFASVNHRQLNRDWFVRLLVLMPDHLHGLIAFPGGPSMATVIRLWKGYLARRHGIVWQREFFDHRIRDDAEYQLKAAYVRANPARAGLLREGERWPFVWEPDC